MLIKTSPDIQPRLKKTEPVFFEIEGILVPFFISESQVLSGETVLISTEDILSDKTASEFLGCKIYLPSQKNRKKKSEISGLSVIIGYELIDIQFGLIGKVVDFIEIPQNPLFKVVYGTKEILVPANENFIMAIDTEKKEIHFDLPAGLLEIYD